MPIYIYSINPSPDHFLFPPSNLYLLFLVCSNCSYSYSWLHPPLQFLLPRKVRENVKVNGYEIPIDTTVLVNAWAIGRDPKHWSDPEKFRPERFLDSGIDYKGMNFQFLLFGAGRRMCIGISFGMTNVEVALANLLYYFDWGLDNGLKAENLDMSEAFGLTTGRKVALHLKATPWKSHPA